MYEEPLTTKQAARHLHRTHKTLQAWRAKGIGPDYFKVGRNIYYFEKDLDDWLNNQTKQQ